MKLVSKYLKDLRIQAGLTQSDIGKHLKFESGHQYVSNWERSACLPPLKHMAKLIKLLKGDKEYFIELYLQDARKILEKAMRVR